MADYFIGVDGGGTGCRAVVADAAGAALGRGESGAANIVTDPQGALKSVLAAVGAAFDAAGLDRALYARSHAALGLAGGNVVGACEPIAAALPFSARVVSDGLTALQGALGDRDGVTAILGTGSVYVARSRGAVRMVGGWGFPLGDLGGGARLGQSLLQECLLAYDGIVETSPLGAEVLAEFGHDPDNLVKFGWNARPGDFGTFAPRVFRAAVAGDAMAVRLLKRSAAHVAATLDMLIAQGAERVSLVGGLAPHYGRWLPQHVQALLVAPRADALDGALQLARAG